MCDAPLWVSDIETVLYIDVEKRQAIREALSRLLDKDSQPEAVCNSSSRIVEFENLKKVFSV